MARRLGGYGSWRGLVAVALGALTVLGFSMAIVRGQLRRAAADWVARESALSQRAHDGLALWFDERIRDARVLRGAQSVQALLESQGVDRDLSSGIGRLNDFVRGYDYLGAYVRDPSGEIVARSAGAIELPREGLGVPMPVDLGHGVAVAAFDEALGAVAFSTSVVDPHGRRRGDVQFIADLGRALTPILGDAANGSSGQRIFLARRTGEDLFVSEPWSADRGTSAAAWRRVSADRGTLAAAIFESDTPALAGDLIGIAGTRVFASARRIAPGGWTVVCEIARDAALTDVYAFGSLEIVVALLVFVVLVALGHAWRRGVLLRDLNERMEALSARARLAAIVESTTDAVVGVDGAGLLTTWNSAAEKLFGYRAAEVLGKHPMMLSPPELRDEAVAMVSCALRGVPAARDTVRMDKKGRRIDVNLTVSPVFAASREVIGTAAILRDITERKRAEEALRRSHAALNAKVNFEALLGFVSSSLLAPPAARAGDAITEALRRIGEHLGVDEARIDILDATRDDEGTGYIWVRRDLISRTTLRPPASVGKSAVCGSDGDGWFVSDVGSAPEDVVPLLGHAPSRGLRSWAMLPLNAGGEAVGTFQLASCAHEIEFSPEVRGQIVLFAQVFANVLLRLRRERDLRRANEDLERRVCERTEALALSERRWQQLFDDAPDAMMLIDAGGAILRVSSRLEKIFSYAAADLVGRDAGLLFSTLDEPDAVASQDWHSPLGVHEVVARRADGTTFAAAMRVSHVASSSGDLLLVSIRNVTAERQLAEQLRLASRMKDEFVAGMSHELRTPLTAILGFTESLLYGTYGPLEVRQRNALLSLERSGEHLLALINDVLDLAKIEAGRMTLAVQPCRVGELCGEVIEIIRPLVQGKGLALDSSVVPADLVVVADDRRLRQMLLNLLSNAVKFTERGGHVRLDAEGDRASGEVRFRVADTGIGIAPSDLPKLFHSFTQLDGGRSRRHDGTGMGLALVQQMAALHHGSVRVDSELGKGSCFTLVVPWGETSRVP